MKINANNQPGWRYLLIAIFFMVIMAVLAVLFSFYNQYPQETLYFISILIAIAVTGFLSYFARKHSDVTGATAFMLMELSICFMAVSEGLSSISATQPQAQFWFNVRFIGGSCSTVLLLIFALDFTGRQDWLTKRFMAALFAFVTQLVLWSNSLHGLWVKRDVEFHQSGPFWIAETSARVPGAWFQIYSLYIFVVGLIATAVILYAAWRQFSENRAKALLLAGGALIPIIASIIPTFNLNPQAHFNPVPLGLALGAILTAPAVFRFRLLEEMPAAQSGANPSPPDIQSNRSMVWFIFIFILMIIAIGVSGYQSYLNYETEFRSQMEHQLSAIGELKANGLAAWRSERLRDANAFYKNPVFSALVQRALENPADELAHDQVLSWLGIVQSYYQYDRVYILDAQAVERFSAPNMPEPVAEHLKQEIAKIIISRQVTFLDFHRDSSAGPIHLAILVPIIGSPPANGPSPAKALKACWCGAMATMCFT
jgi:hypothetical protein